MKIYYIPYGTTKSETKVIAVRLPEETKFAIEMANQAENRRVNNLITNIIKIL